MKDATAGAALIAGLLPEVAANGGDLDARTRLLEGAMHAGRALAERGLFLAHAMAQALGGRYGTSHGALNALCLAPALRFNEPVVPRGGRGSRRGDGRRGRSGSCRGLARLGGFERLRDLGIPGDELGAVAVRSHSGRARSNPRPVSPEEIETLLRSIW